MPHTLCTPTQPLGQARDASGCLQRLQDLKVLQKISKKDFKYKLKVACRKCVQFRSTVRK